MQVIDGRPVFSATDLVGFLACEHLTNLERAAMARLVERPNLPDPELDRVAMRGLQHEQRFLAELQEGPLEVVTIDTDGSAGTRHEQLVQAAEETLTAMRSGADVIYQATFFDGQWRGHADFLRKVSTPSELGDWSYEVWDTKLARHAKGSAILQLCLYTHLLSAAQGLQPALMYLALGGSAREVHPHRFTDYAAYFRLVRDEFLEFVNAGDAIYPPSSRAEPVEHCEVCRWDMACTAARRSADDLSLVAGISSRQRRVLRERGVETRAALGALPLPFVLDPPVKATNRPGLERVREQARLQVAGDAGPVLHEILDPARDREGVLQPDRGLLILPEPSPGDLFFDIEGDPFALEDGVDYLFGVIEPGLLDSEGVPTFHRFWSINATNDVTFEAERAAFEGLIDLIIERLDADPNLHVYHYAPYEPTAVRRLMGRYGTREAEVDRLLRGRVFVDLFRTVRQGIRASVESYSIKRLEPLYGFTREIELRDAGSSIVAFETWLELGGNVPDDPGILDRIEAYNHDDCVSTWRLRDWLEERRADLVVRLGNDFGRPLAQDGDPTPDLSASLAEVQAVADRLTDGVPDTAVDRMPVQQARWLLAQLLHWHRREEKSDWWRYFYLLGLTDEELIAEGDSMGGLAYEGPVGIEKRSTIYRFTFPPQEHKIAPGAEVRDPVTEKSPGTVVAVDDEAGTVDLKRSTSSGPPEVSALVLYGRQVPNDVQRKSLLRLGEWVAQHGIESDGPYRAARDLLLRNAPRVGQDASGALVAAGELARDAARHLVLSLDETYLAIQGPPGSGKTSVGAEMIVDLVEQGKRVGVTSNSHQVIGNLLHEAALAATRRGCTMRIGQKPGTDDTPTCPEALSMDNGSVRDALTAGDVDVVGGTAWLWSREGMENLVDVLFIDEAGQISLANTIAVAPAARNLVLLGDPQQLDQPLKGTHPPGADRSALAHILGEHATMPPDLGLFLGTTWRLHPDLCAYTSEVFYEGRLLPEADRERQQVHGIAPLTGAGLRFIPVQHEGRTDDSEEEAAVVAGLVTDLLDAHPTWTDDRGDERPLTAQDVLLVTPYNAQVRAIREALPGARVGTVDKFQGQQGPIAIYSMATSSADDAPRGMEFLYSLHRLNVATSRARCLAVVVGSVNLLRVRCRTPRQMRLANALVRLWEMARH